jgi:hypothetical protein
MQVWRVGELTLVSTHQCARDESCDSRITSCKYCSWRPYHGLLGQHHSCCLHKTPGRHQVPISVERNTATISNCCNQTGDIISGSHTRSPKRDSRPAIQERSDSPHRMVFTSNSGGSTVQDLGHSPVRPICNQVQQQMSTVHLPSPRPSSSGNRRSVPQLGGGVGICISPTPNYDKNLIEDSSTQVSDHHDSPRVAQATLIVRPDGSLHTGPIQVASDTTSAQATRSGSLSLTTSDPKPTRLDAEKQSLQQRGFSSGTIDRIVAPRRTSTLSIYECKWKAFANWCSTRGKDPFQASSPLVADFLLYLFQVKKSGTQHHQRL